MASYPGVERSFRVLDKLVVKVELQAYELFSRRWKACGDWRGGKRRTIPYETNAGSGTLLFAPEGAAPGPVKLPLGVRGRFRIYVGLPPSDWSESACGIRVRLTGEPSFRTLLSTSSPGSLNEVFWMEADVTGRELEVAPLRLSHPFPAAQGNPVSGIAHVRLEPSSSAPEPKKCPLELAAFIDGHSLRYCSPLRSPADLKEHIAAFRDTPFRRVYWCTLIGDVQQYKTPDNNSDARRPVYLNDGYRNVDQALRAFQRRGLDFQQVARDAVKAAGLEFHIYHRPGLVHPEPPIDQDLQASPFVLAHPEWRCRDRDGRWIARLSYAFPRVQERVISAFKEQLRYNIDGINLAFWRGVPLMLYEKPLLQAFQRATGRDPRRLPPNHPRWLQFRADAVSDYIRRLCGELQAENARLGFGRLVFSAGVLAHRKANLFYGLDIERWIRDGLVNVVIPYQESRRVPPDEMDVDYYADLKRRTGCTLCPEVMSTRSWLTPEQHYSYWAKKLYAAEVDGLCFWDGDMRQVRPLEWEMMKAMASPGAFKREARRLTREHRRMPLRSLGGMAMDKYPTMWTY